MDMYVEAMGPLDLVRQLNAEAGDLDVYAEYDMQSGNLSRQERLQKEVYHINQNHPLIDRRVFVHGRVITPAIDEENGELLPSLPYDPSEKLEDMFDVSDELLPYLIDEHQDTIEGEYKGYKIFRVLNPRSHEWEHRVVHKLAVGEGQYTDGFGKDVVETYNDFVCAWESSIDPVEPIDAHSLVDLQDDKIVNNAFDGIAYSEKYSRAEAIKKIGCLATRIFSKYKDDKYLNHQRISYLNSIGLLEDVVVRAKDFEIGGAQYGYTSPSNKNVMEFDEGYFVLSPGYKRTREGIPYILSGRLELFIKSWINKDSYAKVPMSNILDIEVQH